MLRSRFQFRMAMIGLLTVHVLLGFHSLLQDSPTIDEVVHLPAGLTYWQTGTFKLYSHNPPLIKLLAAFPLLGHNLIPPELYIRPGWTVPNKAVFAHDFAYVNAAQYFELFRAPRALILMLSCLGGVLVYCWSSRLYGQWAGLLSLALWCVCPNILAHSHLVTTDLGATVVGFGATYLFWRYLQIPNWYYSTLAGLVLGLAQLTKFSLLLLYGIWPLLWCLYHFISDSTVKQSLRIKWTITQPLWIGLLSIVVINTGYAFEGVGKPLKSYYFMSRLLTSERSRPTIRPQSLDVGRQIAQFRQNRFKNTLIGDLPVPLPEYYIRGFDEQRFESEGVPAKALVSPEEAASMGADAEKLVGYPVYLNGELRTESWWYYYLATLAYKVPEGTWLLVVMSIVVFAISSQPRIAWANECILWTFPLVLMATMSFATNIALGLRYVLPIAPYIFVLVGKLAPWSARSIRRKIVIIMFIVATTLSSISHHPHYLSYFNNVAGGASRGSEHLIDSNLDWGQDLILLQRWLQKNAPGEGIGVAYFGQINPQIFVLRKQPLQWYLPPALPGTLSSLPAHDVTGPRPGLYAVSASLVRGLPWRVYTNDSWRWYPFPARENAFSYFQELNPVAQIGYSIFIYRVTVSDAERLARLWQSKTK